MLIYHYIEFHPRKPWVSSGNPTKKRIYFVPTLDQRLIDEPKYQRGVYKIVELQVCMLHVSVKRVDGNFYLVMIERSLVHK